ncbi:MAG: HAD family hydrolase [Phycisphaerales bacterium]
MLILFDIDMTLLKASHVGIDCLKGAGRTHFGTEFSIEGIRFGGGLDPVIISQILVLNHIEPTDEHIQLVRATYASQLEQIASERTVAEPLAGAHDLVNATLAHETKPTLGLLTGNYQETGTVKVRSAGFDPALFTINAWGDSSAHASPKRSHLPPVAIRNYHQTVCDQLQPESVIIIGDTEHDVACAKENGCRSLAVATGYVTRQQLEHAGADLVLDDLTQTNEIMRWMMNPAGN